MKNGRNIQRWEKQARQFFGDEFWNDILSVIPTQGVGAEEEEEGSPQQDPRRGHSDHPRTARPVIDIFKTERTIIVQAELPGLTNLAAVDVYMQGGNLVISGHLSRRFTRDQTVQAERFTGDFKRVIELPEPIEEEGIQAKYKNGLLEVVLPRLRRRRENPPLRIRIQQDPDHS